MNPDGFSGHQHFNEKKTGAKEGNEMNDKQVAHHTQQAYNRFRVENWKLFSLLSPRIYFSVK